MGFFSGIADAFSGRKARKEANRAGREILGDIDQYFTSATGRISKFLPQAEERADIAGRGVNQLLTRLAGSQFAPSAGVMDRIQDLSTQATERAAASGRSQSGGLQGELERIRARELFADERNQQNQLINRIGALTPFTQQPIKLEGTLADLDLDRLQRTTGQRRNQLSQVTSAIGKQFGGLGEAFGSAASAAGGKFGKLAKFG